MSILHYFGKVTASYKKYEGDLPQYTGYVFNSKIEGYLIACHGMNTNMAFISRQGIILNDTKMNIPVDIPVELFESSEKGIMNHLNIITNVGNRFYMNPQSQRIYVTDSYISSLSPETYVFSFTTLAETFSKCFEKVREKMYSDLWKTIECCPFINIMDLLLLKQSDTDKHIEHLEQMMCSLMEDNKLLQNRINALETKRAIPVAIPVTVGEILCDA